MQLVVGETVLIDGSLSPYEALRAFFEVAGERGHVAPSVVVSERGEPLTHPDYIDRMGTSHAKAGARAFCRQSAAGALGLPAGTDQVRERDLQLKFRAGSPYLAQPHLHDQVYTSIVPGKTGPPRAPVSSASPVNVTKQLNTTRE